VARKASPPYKVGVVGIKGAGGMGGSHTRAAKLHPKSDVVAICDLNPAGFDAYREAYGPVESYTDINKMLAAHEIDIITIATSDHTHCELVEAACRAGVPMIFCEKPLDVTLERGDRMVRAVEQSGATFACDHTRRWTPTWVNAKKVLDAQFGPPVRIHCYMGDPRAMLFRNGTHIIDALNWFAGDEPAWLVGGEFEDLGVPDPDPACTALLGFRNGCRAFVDFTKKSVDFEIDCICDGGRLIASDHGIRLTRDEGTLGLTHSQLAPSPNDSEGVIHAMRDLIEAYEQGRPTRSTVRDAMRTLEIMTAIIRSHDLGGARIDWPLDRANPTASEGKLGRDKRTLEWR
jgi:predicted dehydrogenase